MRKKKGFTLAELLIVVAIIAVLVAVSIPVFSSQLEKSRRAVDLHTARTIESILLTAFNDGTIGIPDPDANSSAGIWVLLCRDKNSWPKDYSGNSKAYETVFFGADKGIIINGIKNNNAWNVNNANIQKVLKDCGMSVHNMKIKSKDKKDGWDWIIIEAGYVKKKLTTRIYSGFQGAQSGAHNVTGITNIEKMMG